MPAPPDVAQREFGAGVDKKIDWRHLSFMNEQQMNAYLRGNVPFYISYSAGYYEFPEGRPMPKKNWLGADLVFDLDADEYEVDCTHAKSLVCDKCMNRVKEECVKLVEEFLVPDFGFAKHEIHTIFSVTGDTPVLVSYAKDGVPDVKLISIGEAVRLFKGGHSMRILSLSKDGKITFSTVYDSLEHEDTTYELYHECRRDSPLRLTGHHSVFVLNEEGRITPRRVSELKAGDYLVTFNSNKMRGNGCSPRVVEHIYANDRHGKAHKSRVIIDKDFMRLVGYYLAEGSLTPQNSYTVCFSFGSHEKKFISDCMQLIRKCCAKKPRAYHPHPSSTQIVFNSKKWHSFFEKHCGRGAANKRVPDFIWGQDKQSAMELLKGYIRGDGHIGRYNVACKSVSRVLITGLAWLCKLNNIACNIREEDIPERILAGNKVKKSHVWQIDFSQTEFSGRELGRLRPKLAHHPVSKTLPTAPLRAVYRKIRPGLFNSHRVERALLDKERLNKENLLKILKWFLTCHQNGIDPCSKGVIDNYRNYVTGDVGAVRVTKIKQTRRKEKVFDVAVENTEAFFGGDYPILLHNSGNRGYHLHIRKEDVRELSQNARKEVIDYITASGIKAEQHLRRDGQHLYGPRPGDGGWGGRVAKAMLGEVRSGSEQSIARRLGISSSTAKKITAQRELIAIGIENGDWDQVNLDPKTWKRAFGLLAVEMCAEVDKNVTLDVSRLMRLPNSLHGGTGFIACEIANLDKFVYYSDPVVLGDEIVRVKCAQTMDVPLKDKVFELEKEKQMDLPEYAAFYCAAKGLVHIWG